MDMYIKKFTLKQTSNKDRRKRLREKSCTGIMLEGIEDQLVLVIVPVLLPVERLEVRGVEAEAVPRTVGEHDVLDGVVLEGRSQMGDAGDGVEMGPGRRRGEGGGGL